MSASIQIPLRRKSSQRRASCRGWTDRYASIPGLSRQIILVGRVENLDGPFGARGPFPRAQFCQEPSRGIRNAFRISVLSNGAVHCSNLAKGFSLGSQVSCHG